MRKETVWFLFDIRISSGISAVWFTEECSLTYLDDVS